MKQEPSAFKVIIILMCYLLGTSLVILGLYDLTESKFGWTSITSVFGLVVILFGTITSLSHEIDLTKIRMKNSGANVTMEMKGRLKDYIENIKERLKNLAEDRTLSMDVKVYDALWVEIQVIEHDLETKFVGNKK